MRNKSKFIILLFVILIIAVGYTYYQKSLPISTTVPETNEKIEKISDKFVISPKKEYSLGDKSIIIPADTNSIPGIPERIGIKVTVRNLFSKPLWGKGKDCNYNGVLEKKTLTGWIIAGQEKCSDTNQSLPGRSFNNGVDELYYVVFTKNAQGTYRVRLNLLYGCIATKDANEASNYNDCKGEVVSYSPAFSINY